MLRQLSVENYALIDKLVMNLGPGLNTVTGETGAGKSILLGALGLLLGTRSEAGVQKDPSANCVVEGVFGIEGYGLETFFEANDLDYDPATTIRRVVSASGKSRAYVNDLPVQLSVLRELGARLIDIHSQHENLLLRDDRFRISIVDGAARQNDLVKRYGEVYRRWKELQKELAEAVRTESESRRDEEYIRYQCEELTAAALVDGELEELEAEERELSHSDLIREAMGAAATGLGEEETGVVPRLKSFLQSVERVSGIHPRAAEFCGRLSSSYLELRELEREMAEEYGRVEGDPERLDHVTRRLDLINNLLQKHRAATIGELILVHREFSERLSAIEHGGERIARLESETAALASEAARLAEKIGAGRRKAVPEVEKSVGTMLRSLGMPEARLVVEIVQAGELRSNGGDEVRFLFTSNASMAPRPVEKIASGGEISRVMLVLKTLSALTAGQPTIIFDEIDAGVSGQVADAMGDIIAGLGGNMQVVNITHLPQIASKAGRHFVVYKEGGASHIRELGPEERVVEVAKMLSGSRVTDAALDQARELLRQ